MATNIHIGKLIQQKLKESGHTTVWFAQQMSTSRSNIYVLFEKYSIDTATLLRISNILHFNFFKIYSEELEKG